MIAVNSDQPGVIRIAMACSQPLEDSGELLRFIFERAEDYEIDFNVEKAYVNEQIALIAVAIDLDECFIATAAFGSRMEPGVALLRQFRDAKLLTNLPGQAFVSFYYQVSPPIAEHIAGNSLLKTMIRTMLLPVIAAAYLALQPWLLLLAVSLVMLNAYYCRRVYR